MVGRIGSLTVAHREGVGGQVVGHDFADTAGRGQGTVLKDKLGSDFVAVGFCINVASSSRCDVFANDNIAGQCLGIGRMIGRRVEYVFLGSTTRRLDGDGGEHHAGKQHGCRQHRYRSASDKLFHLRPAAQKKVSSCHLFRLLCDRTSMLCSFRCKQNT